MLYDFVGNNPMKKRLQAGQILVKMGFPTKCLTAPDEAAAAVTAGADAAAAAAVSAAAVAAAAVAVAAAAIAVATSELHR